MTREEAITNYIVPAIKRTWNDKKCKEILKALEQEPSGDAISRQAVYDAITEIDCGINMDIYTDEVRKIIDDIPTVGMVKVHSKVRDKE